MKEINGLCLQTVVWDGAGVGSPLHCCSGSTDIPIIRMKLGFSLIP